MAPKHLLPKRMKTREDPLLASNEDPLFASNEAINGEKEPFAAIAGPAELGDVKVNGNKTLSSSKDEYSGFDKFTLGDMLNGEEDLPPLQDMLNSEDLPPMSPSGYGLPTFSFSDLIMQSDHDQLAPNGNSENNMELQLNGTKVQSQEEEAPSKSANATKKWVRGRLVEVGEA